MLKQFSHFWIAGRCVHLISICYRVSFELFVESPSVSVRSSIFVLFHVLALNYEHSRLSAISGTPHGAALAYYTVFSLAPMVLVLLAVFGLIYGNSEVARREILHQLYSFLDRSSAKAVEDIAASAGKPTASYRMRSTPSGASHQSPAGVSPASCARGFYPSPWSPACAFCF